MTQRDSQSNRIIWWILGIAAALFVSYVNNVKADIIRIDSNASTQAQFLSRMGEKVEAIDSRTTRIENKIDRWRSMSNDDLR